MKRNKKRHTWTKKQKCKSRRRAASNVMGFSGMSLETQQLFTDELDRKCKDFFDEDYVHPTRTGRNTAKWSWW